MLNDSARYLHFADIEVQQRAGLIDRRGANHREIYSKLLDLVDGDRSDNSAVALSHGAAG